ncbi:hypothetical protein GPJ56_007706 [Histomonas meleagridis]|uniref:uncharacterized protein n=1 Tax=Histomonas meleagridis TaxID=135588 RepID=UPI00355A666F|nr:hypothetical protein GPJ56_007706 [Histomonas meleagridis]KAH0805899.1 hypothetical protein GO595_001333 [Histomonas meleagridis]
MSNQIPLIAELSNCLFAYKETFLRILTCIQNACDSHKTYDSSIIIQVQDLLSIDAELKRHLSKVDQWNERQAQIKALEEELSQLSGRVNKFAKTLSSTETALQGCLMLANKLQKGVIQRRQLSTIDEIFNTAKLIGPAASGSWRTDFTYPWMPDPMQMQSGAIKTETVAITTPNVAAHSVSMDPIMTKRELALPEDYESTSTEE